MRHFIFEFITSGGLTNQELDFKLAQEGELMVAALVKDLKQIPDASIALCRDARLDRSGQDIEYVVINEHPHDEIRQAIQPDDIVWLIAPESDNCLVEWAEWFNEQNSMPLLSDIQSLRICTSKYQTAKLFQRHDIQVIPTQRADDEISVSEHGWIVKPDDGAGAEQIMVFSDRKQLDNCLANHGNNNNLVVQPYMKGRNMSLSMLCCDGMSVVIGCNLQNIEMQNEQMRLESIEVNACVNILEDFKKLASRIAKALPGLQGYVGIDLIENQQGELIVVEVNPRLTTSYAGLGQSINMNMAEQILDVFQSRALADIDINNASSVRIQL